jgi:hypothetical protein
MPLQRVLGLLVSITNCTVIVVCMIPNVKEFVRYVVATCIITGLIWFNMDILRDPININSIVPIGVFLLPAVYVMKKVNIAHVTFFGFSMLTISGLIVVWGQYAAAIWWEFGSRAHDIAAFTITALILAVYVTVIINNGRRLYTQLFASNRTGVWALYSLYPIVALYTDNKLFYPQGIGSPVNRNIDTAHIMLSLFVFAGLVILCSAIIITQSKVKADTELQFSRRLNDISAGHQQRINEMYDKLRILRHDFKYHLSAARNMLRSGETQKADEYLNGVEEQLAGTEVPKYCGDAVLNALIDSYAERCRLMQIEFSVKIAIPESVDISSHDMCIIIGNLLENAVEACSRLKNGRSIKLQTQNKPPRLLIMVQNSFDGTVQRKGMTIVSAKADGGYGLRSVREVLASCGGDLYTEWNENAFSAFVAIRQREAVPA